MNIVTLAHEIIRMDERIRELEWENAQLREVERDHNEFLQSTLKHNDQMLWNLMEMGMKVAESHPVGVKE
jgi:hypothetical protein